MTPVTQPTWDQDNEELHEQNNRRFQVPISSRTASIADDWKVSDYYDLAECDESIDAFWRAGWPFRRLFDGLDTRVAIDLACGHGRHSAKLLDLRGKAQNLYLLDVNQENVDFCNSRFAGRRGVRAYRNSGCDFDVVTDSAASAIFCYDAMVHFEYDAVLSYVSDAFRVLSRGGRALFHHSNFDSAPGADYKQNPHWRNFMSKNLFAHAASRAGLKVIEQVTIDWAGVPNLDCLSLLEKPSFGIGL